ncbi:2722_t:CDS:1, partial [Racocetra persica]
DCNSIVKVFEVDNFDCNKARRELVNGIIKADNVDCNEVQ